MFDTEDHVRGRVVLFGDSVDLRPDVECLWVGDETRRDNSGPPWRPAIGSLAHRELGLRLATAIDLPPTVGHIVANGISKDMVKGLVVGDVESLLLHDDDQFSLVVHGGCEIALGLVTLADGNRVARRVQCSERLKEQDWPSRDRLASL